MFGSSKILEQKIDIYEQLSKEMLDKLERAVTSIQDNSTKVAIILERHEARLDEGDKANQAIMSLIKRVEHNLEDLEKKVDTLTKFMWTGAGVAMALLIAIEFIPHWGLTIKSNTSMMEPGNTLVNGLS